MDADVYRNMAQLEENHWWFVARRRILAKVIRSLDLPNEANILEAGSGTGGNLEMLSRFGHVTGLEPSSLARSFVRERGDWNVVDGSLPDGLPFEDETFDMVALLDVLEHLEHDAESLAALVRTLKSGGKVVLTVPAFPFLWSAHDEAHHHFRRYRRHQLLSIFDQCGLRTLHSTYFNSILFLPAATVRLSKRLLDRQTADMESLPAASVNRLLTSVFSFERHLLPGCRLPVGLSLLALGQKMSPQ